MVPLVADHFGNLDAIRDAKLEELEEVHEIGPRIALAIYEFFQEKKNRELLEPFMATIAALGPDAITLAEAEGLDGHAHSIAARLNVQDGR